MSVAVVHLVRRENGESPVKTFVDSYRNHPAGTNHRLMLALKGFQSTPDLSALLEGIDHKIILMEDTGRDIGTYLRAADMCGEDVLCFMNSFSEILADQWLAKLLNGLNRLGVGAAGATGSWESHHTSHLLGLFPRRHPRPLWRRLLSPLRSSMLGASFPKFPNYHLRTNAFVIERATLARLNIPKIRSKRDAECFESGYGSLTRRLEDMGLSSVVVGRDEGIFWQEQWSESNTFRRGDQSNLLIADNRTRQYESAGPELKRMLEVRAWGNAIETDRSS